MARRFTLAAGITIITLTLMSAFGGIETAHAANACTKNCKATWKLCKQDRKAILDQAKALYKEEKGLTCKALSGASRTACVTAARAAFKIAKDHKKLGLSDCKSRFKDVQVPMCMDMGLTDACSPLGGFPDALETSLF
jgi:hypothetical protein